MFRTETFDESLVDLIRSASFEEASEALGEHWREYLPQHAPLLVERITSLPAERWESHPALLCALGFAHLCTPGFNPFAAIAYFTAATATGPQPSQIAVEIAVGHARALRALGRVRDARRQLALARDSLSGVGLTARLELEALTLFEEGACLTLVGELDAASRQLRHGLGLVPSSSWRAARIEALGWLALVEYFIGEAIAPVQLLHQVQAMSADADSIEIVPALVVATMVALDDGDDGAARDAAARLSRVASATECAVFARYLSARLDVSADGHLARLEALQAVQLAIEDWQSPVLVRAVHDDERANTLLDLGSIGAARDALADVERRSALHVRHALCPASQRARIALHVGDFEGVLELTAPCRALGDRHAPRSLAHVDLVRAAAHHALGDADTAAAIVDRALLQAHRTGWRRPFTQLPPARLADLLSEASARSQPGAAERVLDDLRGHVAPAVVDGPPALSARERVILGHIVAGQTRRQISAQLSVSPNTVKAQTSSIYRKLGVSNRHEATDRAAKYGLVD